MKPLSTALFVATAMSALLMQIRTLEAATEQVLYSFCSQSNCADGENPNGVIDVDGALYGATYDGGTGGGCRSNYGCGTVFSLDLSTGSEAVLHSFGGGTDGATPNAILVDVKGKIFGTTSAGGYYGGGTAFSIKTRNDAETVLLSFGCCSDGYYPYAGLIHHKGLLYGTTQEGGAYDKGTAFSLDPRTGTFTVLYSFCSQPSCADGEYPLQLIDVGGTLYGMTGNGGANNFGTVFSLDPVTGVETVLHSFANNGTDGWEPYGGLIDVSGTLYGVTDAGGNYDEGTVFSLELNTGAETVLHSFDDNGTDGWYPAEGLIDVNGTLYGTTNSGGDKSCGCGTVFSLDLSTGTETVLYSFQGSDGNGPDSKLIDVNGTLYGTTSGGGQHAGGTVFSITP